MKALLTPYFQTSSLIIYLNKGTKKNFEYCEAPTEKMIRTMYGTWGVDIKEFSPNGSQGAEKLLYREEGSARSILFVGRLVRAKGVFDLIDAFAIVASQISDVKLLLVGNGSEKSELKRRVQQLGLEDRVQFVGTVLNRDLPRYFRGASLFVCPSITVRDWEEQIGMANIQAMACGVPVISTESGAIPEYVKHGETGLLVPEQQPKLLSQAMVDVLSNPELANHLSTTGRKYAVEHYNANENMVRVEEMLLEKCFNGRKRL